MRTGKHTRRFGLAAALVLVGALAACGDDDSSSNPTEAPATTVAGATPDMSDVTLRVGYSVGNNRSRQQLRVDSGVFDGTPYKIEWSEFPGSGLGQQALNSGAIDILMALQPPDIILQQANAAQPWTAADAPFAVITGTRSLGDQGVQIVVGKDSGITSVAELKGKKVAFSKGSTSEYFWLLASSEAGLEKGDVEIAELSLSDARAAFSAGAVDALVAFDTSMVPILRETGAVVIASSGDAVPRYSFMTARRGLHDDPAVEAAVGDLASRELQSWVWQFEHAERSQELLETMDKVDPADAAAVAELGARLPLRIDGTVTAAMQKMADLFYEEGTVMSKTDVAILFDTAFPVVYPPGTP